MSRPALWLVAALLAGCLHDDNGDTAQTAAEPVLDRGADPFVFRTDAPGTYTRIDRMGVPAIATILIPPGTERDRFNRGEPKNDGDFSELIVPRLNLIHFELDDALRAAGFTPCEVDVCIRQAVPEIIPDVLRLRLAEPDGYPNGRTLDDPVVDRVVAVALLDLSAPGDCNGAPCTLSTFEDLPLDPPANEKILPADFPYFATPHPPP